MLAQAPDILSDADFRRISDAVRRHCGINLHEGKKELVRGRLARQLGEAHRGDTSRYLHQILSNPTSEEFSRLIDSVSTNLTGFFREPSHFQYLQNHFLPELLERNSSAKRLRAWSAGCSSGQEAYSLAILLHESLAETEWDMKVLATDISRRMLRCAREGVYDADHVEHLSPYRRQKYFIRQDRAGAPSFSVAPAARELIRFRYLNLMEPFPFSGNFDFIFCRNVMIYFDKPTQERLVDRFYHHLEPGGLLFTGHAESLTGITHRFRFVQPTVYAKARR